ncbi:MAG: YicC/YloC family endoribonuclease [Phenylobacterium sp.]|uniref:YicC/YloC family endoribonuclease n=1 Tax=Phenylobacterium sp. TaxID=1871053 RepID=UPI00273327DC|nr:YicC/YloC family endoribonuclease [Phenylobacterium sp.]MDP3174833.1 YicC/YloC family endoribonuclease [Phenylobacterium sp.]
MALSGMTGFGRTEGAAGDWSWAVEARSVNGRNLDVRFRGPSGFESLERAAREGAQSRFQRGQLTLNVQAKRADSGAQVQINTSLLALYAAAGADLVAAGRAEKPRLDGLLALRGVIEAADAVDTPEAQAALEAAIAISLGGALDALAIARGEEGAALTGVLTGLVDRIEALVEAATAQAGEQPLVLKERFVRRMAELVGDPAGLEDRIAQEAAALAVKADVREELDRLIGHVAAARTLIASDGAAGRRLDFLTQEFMREANTLCSKSAMSALTVIGLDLKAVIEQFREQVQNVE